MNFTTLEAKARAAWRRTGDARFEAVAKTLCQARRKHVAAGKLRHDARPEDYPERWQSIGGALARAK